MFSDPTAQPIEFPGLRPYQNKGINKIRGISLTKKRILVVGPTGCGKSVIFCAIIKTSTLPVLFVCDRVELINQAVEHLLRQGISNIGVIRADDPRENPAATVQVASIQTLLRRTPPFQTEADVAVGSLGTDQGPVVCHAEILIILDEAHLSASDSYRTAVFDRYPNAIILGFSASPSRLDGRPLGALYEHLEIIATYEELFKNPNWLVAPDVYSAPVKVDLANVHLSKLTHDYDEVELAQVMNTRELTGQILDHWLARAHMHPVFKDGIRQPGQFVEGERRRTFGFAVDIQHSEALCERFERAGVKVAHLDHKTPEDQRRAMLRDLESGALEIIFNVEIFLKGVDVVPAKCVIHARPTKSLVLWRQSCGRIFRPWCGVVPLILDHARNYDEHFAPHEDRNWSLTHGSMRLKGHAPIRMCPSCYAYVAASRTVCPYCNVEFPKPAPGELPAETKEELELRSHDPDAAKRARFEKALSIARTQGFKPGYASAKFKEHYGEWPLRSWGEYAKIEFAKDTLWQALVARREDRKRLRAEQETREALSGFPQDPSPPDDMQAPPSCSFCGSTFLGADGACVKCRTPQPDEPWVAPATPEIVAFREKMAKLGTPGIAPELEPDPWGLTPDSDAPFADWVDGELNR
jgi:superfamily II DNA or RNA helicase